MKLAPDWIARMVASIEASPHDVACIASRILNWDGTSIDYLKGEMTFNGMGLQPGYGARLDSPEAQRHADEVLFACGGAMLIKREVFLEVGGFDEDYFAYYEDVDLGWRLWTLGHRVRFCPEAVVYHLHNGTSKRFDWWKKTVLFERNALCSVIKNYEDASLATIWPAALLLASKRIAVRAGVDRDAFRFGPTPPPIAATPAEPTSGLRKLRANLSRIGLKGTLQKASVLLARKVLARWGTPADAPQETVQIPCEAYAGLVGLEDVIDLLPRMLAKRREIQAKRKRSDAEIAALFGDAFMPIEGRGDYIPAHWQVVRELDLPAILSQSEEAAR
ncbi:N-acetylglucosaminyl-diphospho-decaprenol L-rhamnosyltransferase [compost metagenome]